MNAIQTIQHEGGQIVPIVNQVVYLGTTTTANGNYHDEISARKATSMTTFKKTCIYLKRNATIQKMEAQSIWRCYYHEAALRTRISIIIKRRQNKSLDAFQNKGLRKIIGIKHAYFSRIRNQQVIATANQETIPKKNKNNNQHV